MLVLLVASVGCGFQETADDVAELRADMEAQQDRLDVIDAKLQALIEVDAQASAHNQAELDELYAMREALLRYMERQRTGGGQ